MNFLALIQTAPVVEMVGDATTVMAQQVPEESYFSLVLKGGWILLPIFLLSLLAIYVIINKWIAISRAGKADPIWLSRVLELISDGKIDKAHKFCIEQPYALAKVVGAGLKEIDNDVQDIEESMEIEARQQINNLENQMNWLSITASVAPMLGFLGTIFGVIIIFYDIARTNDLAIDTISTGLYQKMICSGAGLLVGIVAYAGYYLLNGRIDEIVVNMDKSSNEVMKAIKGYKKRVAAQVEN